MIPQNEIVITNVKEAETINYSTVLLKGRIYHNCNDKNDNSKVILNEIPIKNIVINSNKHFKILSELNPGSNNITIYFCCLSKTLKIIYKPKESPQKLIPLYIINKNHNGKFQSPKNVPNDPKSAIKRIETIIKLLQCFLGEKLNEEFENGRRTFQFEPCKIFYSDLNVNEAIKMNQKDLWEFFGREIMNSPFGNENNKYIGFLSHTKYMGNKDLIKYEEIIAKTEGFVAIGGGGLALLGTGCIYTWPESIFEVFEKFNDNNLVDCDNFLNDSCYRNTLSGCFSTTLGSVLHELCHTFDLGHSDDGIMGRDYHNLDKFFTEPQKDTLLNHSDGNLLLKNGFIRENYNNKSFPIQRNTDLCHFTKSCSTIIYYHKFFNNYPSSSTIKPSINRLNRLVRSTNGLRVVEIRQKEDELVLKSWVFLGKVLKFSFQIPESIENKIVVIVDNLGNIIKD